jgi:hypothetical protein
MLPTGFRANKYRLHLNMKWHSELCTIEFCGPNGVVRITTDVSLIIGQQFNCDSASADWVRNVSFTEVFRQVYNTYTCNVDYGALQQIKVYGDIIFHIIILCVCACMRAYICT